MTKNPANMDVFAYFPLKIPLIQNIFVNPKVALFAWIFIPIIHICLQQAYRTAMLPYTICKKIRKNRLIFLRQEMENILILCGKSNGLRYVQ